MRGPVGHGSTVDVGDLESVQVQWDTGLGATWVSRCECPVGGGGLENIQF